MSIDLTELRDKDVRELLLPFDFQVRDGGDHAWFDKLPHRPFEIIAQKGSGCIYALAGPTRHVLFVSSEGQAGVIAANLQDCLELVIAHPYWEDFVRQSKGDLDEMRRLFVEESEDADAEYLEFNPEIEDNRPLLRKKFGLSEPAERLYDALTVLGADVVVRAPDGHPHQPLLRKTEA